MRPLGRDSTQWPIAAFEGGRRGHMLRDADGIWKLEKMLPERLREGRRPC